MPHTRRLLAQEKWQMDAPLLMTVPKASRELGINEKTLRKGIENHEVPGVKVGRLTFVPRWWLEQQASGPAVAQGADA